jgi:hypothetical protein
MSAEYKKAHEAYLKAAEAARGGDKDAFKAKAKIVNEIRQMERLANREGRPLNAVYRDANTVEVQVGNAPTKRSLQEEYVRKFENRGAGGEEPIVSVGGKNQKLSEYHRKRLLKA